MRAFILAIVMSSTAITVPFAAANAQSATVNPADLPSVSVPGAPSGADETYDENAIEQLMYIVGLSRTVAGGISQIFSSTKSMTSLLGSIRDTGNSQLTAMTGTKTVPMNNSADDISARDGGTSIRGMVLEGLANPTEISTAFSDIVTEYELDQAFKSKDGDTVAEKSGAEMASYGAVGAAMGERLFARANDSMGRIDGYIQALSSSPDLKTSIDLNTRVNLEVAQQINEMLRGQAAITNLIGMYYVSALGASADMANNFNIRRLWGAE